LAICWLLLAGVGCLLCLPGAPGNGVLRLSLLLGTAVIGAFGCLLLAQRSARDPRWVARKVEARHPELGALLLAAVEQEVPPGSGIGFLQTAVVSRALQHGRSHDWTQTVPARRLWAARVGNFVALALLVAVSAILINQTLVRPSTASGAASTLASSTEVTVEPGNVEIERGTPLLVVARFLGTVPAEATLVVEGGGQPEAIRPMTRNLEDPTFAGHAGVVNADLNYRVEFGGKSTETFHAKVFEYPELKRADAHLEFPKFTGLQPRTIADVRHVTAVEGTELKLLCHLNKEVAQARLIDTHDQELTLAPNDPTNHVYTAGLTLKEPRRFRLHLVDQEGRSNKLPSEIVINVAKNQPPSVAITQPGRDARVSALEELSVKADLRDDFGLTRFGLTVIPVGQPARDVVLSDTSSSVKRAQPSHVIDFEALKAQPDQVITYFFWAEDLGTDGKPRRTSGDMYFAEVRPFEEIFRQGDPQSANEQRQQQQQNQGENVQPADQLAELQKQIINGIWKLVRREIDATPSAQLTPDSKVLRQSQQSALEKADQLAERLEDPGSIENLGKATGFMKEAEKQLGVAADKNAIAGLQPALSAAQSAYQALLKLRAREFNVQRSNQRQAQQGQSGSRSPSQEQMRQLDLTNDRNRYETQSSAREQQQQQAQKDRERKETQEIADRLRELARRQNDLNDRMKELQSALEQARSEQQKEELQRQLKRLQDQQKQMLRDTDDLRERMDRDDNRERMAEARNQTEQSRENLRQAAEALEQGRMGQAITEGTRAGRQLNDLRDELRRQSANRFADEMRDMREQARKLDEDQKNINQQLEESRRNAQKALRESAEREQMSRGLEHQRERLDQLMDRMRRTVGEAEQPEPRLAQELYNTVRNATEQKAAEALNSAQRLAGAGLANEASEAAQRAGQGVEQVRQGIERAAENILGGDTDALRRAQRELDELAEQLNREIAQETGRDPNERPGQRGRNGQQSKGEAARQPNQQNQPGQQGQRSNRDNSQADQQSRQGNSPQPGTREGQRGRQHGQRSGQRGQRQEDGQQPGQDDAQEQRPGNPRPGQQNQQGQNGSQQSGQQNQPGAQQPGQRGQPGSRQPGQQGQQGQNGTPQPGQQNQPGQPGSEQSGQQGGRQGQPGQRVGQQGQQRGQRRGLTDRPNQNNSPPSGQPGEQGQQQRGTQVRGNNDGREGPASGQGGPIRGEGFRKWFDRLRGAEELLEDPRLKADAATIRDRARSTREDFKRHAKEPNWNQLQDLVARPLTELRQRVSEEIRRRESPNSLVPIDRDPVPPEYSEALRRYYERLGSDR
jgi:hypothetical protein